MDYKKLVTINGYRGPSVHGGPEFVEEIVSEDKMNEFFLLICDAIRLLASIEHLEVEQSQPTVGFEKIRAVLTYVTKKSEAEKDNLAKMLEKVEIENRSRKEVIDRLARLETQVPEKDKPFLKALGRFIANAASEGAIGEIIGMAIRILTKT